VYPATDALAGRTRKPRGCGNTRKHAVCATTDTGTKGQKGLRGGARYQPTPTYSSISQRAVSGLFFPRARRNLAFVENFSTTDKSPQM
jgi:hypothetical protein